jgi:hypothetical protein
MRTPISPSALVAWRTLSALQITGDADKVRHALILWCRPTPPLSVSDVAEIMAAVADAAPDLDTRVTEVFDLTETPPRGTVRTNLEPGELVQ